MFLLERAKALLLGSSGYQDVHKKDDDSLLPELENWKRTYMPETIGAIPSLLAQQQRIDEMVSALLRLKDLATVEDEVTDHCKQVVGQCDANGRDFLGEALARTFFRGSQVGEPQRSVLVRIHRVVLRADSKPLGGKGVSGFWSGSNAHQDMHKKDDDNLLLELENWKKTYAPETIGAAHNLLVQRRRIDEMVSSLLRFKDLTTVEDEVSDHCRRVIGECDPNGRSFLAEAFSRTFSDQSQVEELQQSVLVRIHLVVLRSAPKPLKIRDTCPLRSACPFGAAEWGKYFGNVEIEPPLPSDIKTILGGPCPIWAGKKVYETHLLAFIPQTVNGKPLTLKLLGELIQKPLQGNANKYGRFDLGEYTDPPVPASHWILMTRSVLPGSRGKSYSDQQTLVPRSYAVPSVLDAAVSIALEYVRTGKRLYEGNPLTFTRCQEKYDKNWQLVVGNFSVAGLEISGQWGDYPFNGLGALRKF